MTSLGSILMAEDDESIVNLIVEVLTEEGYAVQSAVTGTEALTALLDDRPDLALIDLHLPDRSGLEIVEAARAQASDVPLVIMTASRLAEDDVTAIGARAVLLKPFDLDDLLACVAQHIRRPEGR
jgi:DNA-binding response OmpR family regulator